MTFAGMWRFDVWRALTDSLKTEESNPDRISRPLQLAAVRASQSRRDITLVLPAHETPRLRFPSRFHAFGRRPARRRESTDQGGEIRRLAVAVRRQIARRLAAVCPQTGRRLGGAGRNAPRD